ncbi:hypothetical protein SAMN05660657_03517 [Geodermatophilus amargosae]|uniref:MarR family protein n=1 Tax=Geodermatophilus amargosae TaxID=1296565 RepID=A0A1I7BDF9_9ACTN|nr:hypothetical protein SAMN05660657_03517 [Geodermatophilus amargosae]
MSIGSTKRTAFSLTEVRDHHLRPVVVRAFNRTVTPCIGALEDHFLACRRPLGHSRVLWDIDPDGSDVRDLRARLDLDSGYLSRILRGLQAEGLV